MRLTLSLLALVVALQGCTAIGFGIAADTRRAERAAATSTGAALLERPPTPGDTLTVWLTDGTLVRDAARALSPDSLFLASGAAFALRDIERAERPWTPSSANAFVFAGFLADAVVLWLAQNSLRIDLSGAF